MSASTFQFYLPKTASFPATYGDLWENMPRSPRDSWDGFTYGPFCWVLLTYLWLKELYPELPIVLTSELPTSGIVIAYRDHLTDDWVPPAELYVVCLQADRAPHPHADYHIVQNPRRPRLWFANRSGQGFIPHWPPAAVIPREPSRGNRVERIGFFGLPIDGSLGVPFRGDAWSRHLETHGFQWVIKPRDSWDDYSDVDVVFALRDTYGRPYHFKPASKLVNAWLGGVPAVLGPESSYRALRSTADDYMEATNEAEVIAWLNKLRSDSSLYERMRLRAIERGKAFTHRAIARAWVDLLHEIDRLRKYHRRNALARRAAVLASTLRNTGRVQDRFKAMPY